MTDSSIITNGYVAPGSPYTFSYMAGTVRSTRNERDVPSVEMQTAPF